MRLWELEAGDDGEFGQGYGGGRAGGVGDFGDGDDDDDSDDDDDDVQIERLPPVLGPPMRYVPPMVRAPPRAPPVAAAAPAAAGPGRGARIRAERNIAVGEAAGLQRFLEMARDDNEDEWDSDEMSDDELEHGMQALNLE